MMDHSSDLYNAIEHQTTFIFGPCVIENREVLNRVAEEVNSLSNEFSATFFFKASFDKANRTSVTSYRGPGLDEGVKLLQEIKDQFQLPIVTDIHEPRQATQAAKVADVIQIPAFLCRQTDLLIAAAETGKIVNIKKAQFLSGGDMLYPLEKVKSTGNSKVMLTERGSMFGYNNLVVDFRNIPAMQEFGVPVIMDCTHSVQRPGGLKGTTGGNREFIPHMAKAAKAFGANAFFLETHPDPDNAKSDGPNMLPVSEINSLVKQLLV